MKLLVLKTSFNCGLDDSGRSISLVYRDGIQNRHKPDSPTDDGSKDRTLAALQMQMSFSKFYRYWKRTVLPMVDVAALVQEKSFHS